MIILEIMDINRIKELLPHRYPFLLVDRVVHYESGRLLRAIKNVTTNEPFFQGHFPTHAVMPGVLIIEAMAQATGLLAFEVTKRQDTSNSLFYLVGVDNCRFKNQVVPGDQLILEVEVVKALRGVWKFKATAKVEDKLAASADLMCAERDA
ncbi:MAG: 3-hydroxyacyl-ACP dehydratase FabZ [Gammaproteobacteria bacterium]|nr:3-hydroxyacyl-ACP dehydratase FabZ [Gammaproteobacteria bacterium]MDH5729774.1 3-hydroxyacyl-ACP dehydratase FabZ [Gammaproteobacteria bacterium]